MATGEARGRESTGDGLRCLVKRWSSSGCSTGCYWMVIIWHYGNDDGQAVINNQNKSKFLPRALDNLMKYRNLPWRSTSLT